MQIERDCKKLPALLCDRDELRRGDYAEAAVIRSLECGAGFLRSVRAWERTMVAADGALDFTTGLPGDALAARTDEAASPIRDAGRPVRAGPAGPERGEERRQEGNEQECDLCRSHSELGDHNPRMVR